MIFHDFWQCFHVNTLTILHPHSEAMLQPSYRCYPPLKNQLGIAWHIAVKHMPAISSPIRQSSSEWYFENHTSVVSAGSCTPVRGFPTFRMVVGRVTQFARIQYPVASTSVATCPKITPPVSGSSSRPLRLHHFAGTAALGVAEAFAIDSDPW